MKTREDTLRQTTQAARRVVTIVESIKTLEGGGFPVRRPFPTTDLSQVDPFLLLDHLGPVKWGPGEAIGAPDHPHRGFETVTYLLSGGMRHKDSSGHTGHLGPGDVQWMTAGAGVVHSEMPDEEFLRAGGIMHGFQVWVNLPAQDKMIAPYYQEIPSEHIPEAVSGDGLVKARVIAGEAMGKSAVIATRTPIMYLHYTLQPGGAVTQPVPSGHNALVYVFSGEALVGPASAPIGEGRMALLDDGDAVLLGNGADAAVSANLLLLAGLPLREPVARYGPFVMNTEAEIRQALADYREGRMGRIAG